MNTESAQNSARKNDCMEDFAEIHENTDLCRSYEEGALEMPCRQKRAEMWKQFCIERPGGARHCKHAQDERASGNTNQDTVVAAYLDP